MTRLDLTVIDAVGKLVSEGDCAPGAVLWPEQGLDEARRDRIRAQTPLQRPGSPEDIARAVLFFATQAPFVTGQVLAVDGGRSIGW